MLGAIKKTIAFLLLFVAIFSLIPFGTVFAAGRIVVVDAAGTLTNGAIGNGGNVLVIKSTITEAIDYLGKAGGTVYINGSFNPASAEGLEGKDTAVTTRGAVTIEGYDGNALLDLSYGKNNTDCYAFPLKGDLTFKNIEIKAYSHNAAIISTGFYSYGYKLTFGEGVTTTHTTYRLGHNVPSNSGTNNPDSEWYNDIDIKSGTFQTAAPMMYQFCSDTLNYSTSVRYSLYGGEIRDVYTQPLAGNNSTVGSNANYLKAINLSGDFEFNMYGGTVTNMYVGTIVSGDFSVIKGNTLVNINEGNISRITVGHQTVLTPTANIGETGNITIILNGKKSSTTTVAGNDNAQYFNKADNKKFIVIVNNAEGGQAAVDTTNDQFKKLIDYNIAVTNGKAEPVFEGKASSAVLKGFKITPDSENSQIYINGNAAYPIEGTDDIYSIEPFGAEVIDITVNVAYKVVVASETYEAKANEKHFTDISSAIAYLSPQGGTVYVKGAVTTDNLASSAAVQHDLITVTGYNNSAENSLIITNAAAPKLYGDITFKNITLIPTGGTINSGGHTLTLDEGTVAANIKPSVVTSATHYANNKSSNVIINSDFVSVADGISCHNVWGDADVPMSFNTTLNKGAMGVYIFGMGNACTGTTGQIVNGDISFTMSGGTVNKFYLGYNSGRAISGSGGSAGSGAAPAIKGNTVVRINGGTVLEGFGFGPQGSNTTPKVHNIAVIIDKSALSSGFDIHKSNSLEKISADYSKWMIIINNAECDYAEVNVSDLKDVLDYHIEAYNSEVEPEFSARTSQTDATASRLLGFRIRLDNGDTVLANGEIITADENGLYNLDKFLGNKIIIKTATDEKTSVVYDEIFNVSDFRKTDNYVAPDKNGYVFGGWYSEADNENAVMNEAQVNLAAQTGTPLYAKFVPTNVLRIGWQISAGTTAESKTTKLRLVSTVDSFKYSKVRFTLAADGIQTMIMESNTVYSSLRATGYDGDIYYDPTIFSPASHRFMTVTVTNVPQDYFGKPITAQAFWLTKDGTLVGGRALDIYINTDFE